MLNNLSMFNNLRPVSGNPRNVSPLWEMVVCAVVLGCLSSLMSCGRKDLPTPVIAITPPVVAALQAQIDGDMVKLTWPVPIVENKDDDRLAGFRVYRSLEDISDPVCEDCPRPFKQASELNIGKTAPGETMSYTEAVKKGFRYFYRVSCYTEEGSEGEKSETVTVTP